MFMANPGRAHWEGIKSILRYLKGSKSKCRCYGKGPLELKGFCDSDMVGDVDTCCRNVSPQVAMYTPLQVELFHGALDFRG